MVFGASGQTELLGQNILPGQSEPEEGQTACWVSCVAGAWVGLRADRQTPVGFPSEKRRQEGIRRSEMLHYLTFCFL